MLVTDQGCPRLTGTVVSWALDDIKNLDSKVQPLGFDSWL